MRKKRESSPLDGGGGSTIELTKRRKGRGTRKRKKIWVADSISWGGPVILWEPNGKEEGVRRGASESKGGGGSFPEDEENLKPSKPAGGGVVNTASTQTGLTANARNSSSTSNPVSSLLWTKNGEEQ